MNPRISIIVPIHNTEPFLDRCLTSIVDQAYQDFEVLCIDDASPDSSSKIVERFIRKDARIRLVRHDRNSGLGAARNTGIRLALGTYVTGVDSDDYVDPDFLAQLYSASDQETSDIVVCGIEKIHAWGDEIAKHQFMGGNATFISEVTPQQNVFKLNLPSFCNKLWRRSLFTGNDIWFPEGVYYEDLATTPRLFLSAKGIRFIDSYPYKYLVRKGSIMGGMDLKHISDYFRVFDIIKDFLMKNNVWASRESQFRELVVDQTSFYQRNMLSKFDQTNLLDVTDRLVRLVRARREYLLSYNADEVIQGIYS